MQTQKFQGYKVDSSELIDVFSHVEGSINLYYGQIGNGKTYAATADILELLKRGHVVYANWHINTSEFDDRKSLLVSFFNIILFRSRFYRIPCQENFHYFDPEDFEDHEKLMEWLSRLNDCDIFFDEGQDLFDSYDGTRVPKIRRRLFLHTRHYHRTLNVITQRPTAIQVSARANVNRFYKCIKIANWPWVRFARVEYQEMKGETVDETVEKPVSVKRYFASKKVFRAYNTDYIAEGIPRSQAVNVEAFDFGFIDRFVLFVGNFFALFRGRSAIEAERPLEGEKKPLKEVLKGLDT